MKDLELRREKDQVQLRQLLKQNQVLFEKYEELQKYFTVVADISSSKEDKNSPFIFLHKGEHVFKQINLSPSDAEEMYRRLKSFYERRCYLDEPPYFRKNNRVNPKRF